MRRSGPEQQSGQQAAGQIGGKPAVLAAKSLRQDHRQQRRRRDSTTPHGPFHRRWPPRGGPIPRQRHIPDAGGGPGADGIDAGAHREDGGRIGHHPAAEERCGPRSRKHRPELVHDRGHESIAITPEQASLSANHDLAVAQPGRAFSGLGPKHPLRHAPHEHGMG